MRGKPTGERATVSVEEGKQLITVTDTLSISPRRVTLKGVLHDRVVSETPRSYIDFIGTNYSFVKISTLIDSTMCLGTNSAGPTQLRP